MVVGGEAAPAEHKTCFGTLALGEGGGSVPALCQTLKPLECVVYKDPVVILGTVLTLSLMCGCRKINWSCIR